MGKYILKSDAEMAMEDSPVYTNPIPYKDKGMGKIMILNPKSKSDIVIYIDKSGHKRWKWKTERGAIYGKLKKVL